MIVGTCKITLRLHSVSSLKAKRQIVKKVVERIKNRFNASVAEVGSHDIWQRAQIGIAVAGNEGSFVNSQLDRIVDFVEAMHLAEITETDMEVISL